MATKRIDPDRADERTAPATPRIAARIRAARFLGGVWIDADGVPLTAVESQQAHRLADAEALAAREAARRDVQA